jgi:epsilon-lactone hydrolase
MNDLAATQPALGIVRDRIARSFGSWTRETTLEQMRAGFDDMLANTLPAEIQRISIGAMEADWISTGAMRGAPVILYFHGGGYQIGSIISHRELMIRLSKAGCCRVLGFNYRLAPEHRFPAAVEDGIIAYRWLLDQGLSAADIAFCGDSAGAGLAVATIFKARDIAMPLPRCAALLSPWLDMEATGETYRSRAEVDPMTQRDKILLMARTYLGKTGDPRNPLASPIHGDLSGLPPTLIHVGDHETVLDDSRVFAEKAKRAGCDVDLVIWDDMIHHFQIFSELPEAHASIEALGAFFRGQWSAS